MGKPLSDFFYYLKCAFNCLFSIHSASGCQRLVMDLSVLKFCSHWVTALNNCTVC